MGKKIIFHSINFFDYEFKYLIKKLQNSGGYIVAPAASSLSEIFSKKIYYQSLRRSNIAILDSGFFCILLYLFLFREELGFLLISIIVPLNHCFQGLLIVL